MSEPETPPKLDELRKLLRRLERLDDARREASPPPAIAAEAPHAPTLHTPPPLPAANEIALAHVAPAAPLVPQPPAAPQPTTADIASSSWQQDAIEFGSISPGVLVPADAPEGEGKRVEPHHLAHVVTILVAVLISSLAALVITAAVIGHLNPSHHTPVEDGATRQASTDSSPDAPATSTSAETRSPPPLQQSSPAAAVVASPAPPAPEVKAETPPPPAPRASPPTEPARSPEAPARAAPAAAAVAAIEPPRTSLTSRAPIAPPPFWIPERFSVRTGVMTALPLRIAEGTTLEGRVAAITGLRRGIRLSAGSGMTSDAWQVKGEALIGLAMFIPSGGLAREIDIGIEIMGNDIGPEARMTSRIEVETKDNQAPALPLQQRAVPEPAQAARLRRTGEVMFDNGEIAAGRRMLEQAATLGSADAAIALAATYDPVFIARMATSSQVRPEPEKARQWYGRAVALGADDAQPAVDRLTPR